MSAELRDMAAMEEAEYQEYREDLLWELRNAERYANDIIRRLHKADFVVDVKLLKMIGPGGRIPQLGFAVKEVTKPESEQGAAPSTAP